MRCYRLAEDDFFPPPRMENSVPHIIVLLTLHSSTSDSRAGHSRHPGDRRSSPPLRLPSATSTTDSNQTSASTTSPCSVRHRAALVHLSALCPTNTLTSPPAESSILASLTSCPCSFERRSGLRFSATSAATLLILIALLATPQPCRPSFPISASRRSRHSTRSSVSTCGAQCSTSQVQLITHVSESCSLETQVER